MGSNFNFAYFVWVQSPRFCAVVFQFSLTRMVPRLVATWSFSGPELGEMDAECCALALEGRAPREV